MPVWGNRMVCETANYKHIEEKKKEFLERENTLGRYREQIFNYFYRVCHGFRLTKKEDYFWVAFATHEASIIFKAIGYWLSLKPNHDNKVLFVQICERSV